MPRRKPVANSYQVKRLNLGDEDHFIVMNPDKTIHSDHATHQDAEREAARLNALQIPG